jgi:hypothetical protein
VEVCEFAAFGSQAIKIRRLVTFCAKRPDIAVTLVVYENDDDVGEPFGGKGYDTEKQHEDER